MSLWSSSLSLVSLVLVLLFGGTLHEYGVTAQSACLALGDSCCPLGTLPDYDAYGGIYYEDECCPLESRETFVYPRAPNNQCTYPGPFVNRSLFQCHVGAPTAYKRDLGTNLPTWSLNLLSGTSTLNSVTSSNNYPGCTFYKWYNASEVKWHWGFWYDLCNAIAGAYMYHNLIYDPSTETPTYHGICRECFPPNNFWNPKTRTCTTCSSVFDNGANIVCTGSGTLGSFGYCNCTNNDLVNTVTQNTAVCGGGNPAAGVVDNAATRDKSCLLSFPGVTSAQRFNTGAWLSYPTTQTNRLSWNTGTDSWQCVTGSSSFNTLDFPHCLVQ